LILVLVKIISGGQTGADMGALVAARELGLESGGSAPKGWLTENGPQEGLLQSFGLIECDEGGYPIRTSQNVANSDGTLLVGPYQTGGSRLTYEVAKQLKKPLFLAAWPKPPDMAQDALRIEEFRDWLERYDIKTLNVAGNRESETPGIAEFTRSFLRTALGLNLANG
jgi:Circularly permutated YpsA SLOG family